MINKQGIKFNGNTVNIYERLKGSQVWEELTGGFLNSSKVRRIEVEYLFDFKGLKICTYWDEDKKRHILVEAISGAMVAGNKSRDIAIKEAYERLVKLPDEHIEKYKKMLRYYGTGAVHAGAVYNIVRDNTLVGKRKAIRNYNNRVKEDEKWGSWPRKTKKLK